MMRRLVIALAFSLLVAPRTHAATISILNSDGPGEGFNDPTVVPAVPGNPNTTLGEQRLFAFAYAANLWGQCLQSEVAISVAAQMNPQFCSATSAVLGAAGTTTVHRDFAGAAIAGTWYCQALANSLAGVDLSPATPDISAVFNSSINGDPGCLGGFSWYYGTDANPPADGLDFISVVGHEIGHGLGFQTFQNSQGEWYGGFPDAYGRNMFCNNVPFDPRYPYMTAAQRAACNIADPDLVWNGACVKAVSLDILTTGVGGAGRVRLHGPNPYQSGSSLSHWSPALSPNQMMEPFYTEPNHDITLEVQLLKDTGWVLTPKGPVATAVTAFDVRPAPRAVDIRAEFYSDASEFTVTVFRGDGDAAPTVLIHGADLRNGETFSYRDQRVIPGEAYTYQLSVRDGDGEFYSPRRTVQVPAVDAGLSQNVPNPFNPTTTIGYSLPATQVVRLTVYDAKGRLVRTLVNGVNEVGPHEVTWDGKDDDGQWVGTGVYFYRLVSGNYAQSRKMVLLK